MITAIIILSILLVLSLVFIFALGLDDGWNTSEWLAAALFIFCFPVWAVIKVVLNIKYKHEKNKRRGK